MPPRAHDSGAHTFEMLEKRSMVPSSLDPQQRPKRSEIMRASDVHVARVLVGSAPPHWLTTTSAPF